VTSSDRSPDRAESERIDAAHPRPDRPTPDRTGEGHGDGQRAPDGGLTGDDVLGADERSAEPSGGDAERSGAEVDEGGDRYRDSPGAGLLRDEDQVPEPNEPG
jgi:hypothetical protein